VRADSDVDLLNSIQDWRTRAKRIRVIAETMLDAASRQALLRVADDWEQMAQLTEEGEEKITLVPAASGDGLHPVPKTPSLV
jgi:hypothetical protein